MSAKKRKRIGPPGKSRPFRTVGRNIFTALKQALCRELLLTDGVLEDVSVDRVRKESAKRREIYYDRRLRGTVLNARRNLTAVVVNRVVQEHPEDPIALADLCEDEIERSGLADNPNFGATPGEFADALVEQGVLAFTPDGRYDVAIPSMGRWLGSPSPRV